MRRLCTIALFLAAASALSAPTLHAQVFLYEGASLETSWYAPELGYYTSAENFQVDLPGSVLTQVHLEFELLPSDAPVHARLRWSGGYWEGRGAATLHPGDASNERLHRLALRIVPLSASVVLVPSFAPRPLLGAGISQNLIQRAFERTNADGRTQSFDGNGRDFTYHGLLGFEFPVHAPVWAGLEARYVWGGFTEETVVAGEEASVASLSGLQLGLSIHYRIR